MTVSTSLLGLIIALAFQSMSLGQSVAAEGGQLIRADRNVQAALDVMLPEIRQSGPALIGSDLKVDASGQALAFRMNLGFKDGMVLWSDPIVYKYDPDSRMLMRQVGTAAPAPIATSITEDLLFTIAPDGDQVFIAIGSQLDPDSPSVDALEIVTLRN
ncbi:MAG: hypothetical protein ACYS22_02415 [Planctomycetota bacterium]